MIYRLAPITVLVRPFCPYVDTRETPRAGSSESDRRSLLSIERRSRRRGMPIRDKEEVVVLGKMLTKFAGAQRRARSQSGGFLCAVVARVEIFFLKFR